jgi:acyl-coenzyme A synthetase/AMP-(fatty) acid ligase
MGQRALTIERGGRMPTRRILRRICQTSLANAVAFNSAGREELAMVCHSQPGSVLTEDGLHENLRSALPAFKVPKYLALTDKPLPRNVSEKIHRLALRNSFVAN